MTSLDKVDQKMLDNGRKPCGTTLSFVGCHRQGPPRGTAKSIQCLGVKCQCEFGPFTSQKL